MKAAAEDKFESGTTNFSSVTGEKHCGEKAKKEKQTTNFRLFQTDDNFKFDENGRKSSKRVENTVGKGEIARYEQFLLFPQCFQKACFPGASKGVIVWEWVNSFPNDKILDWSKLKAFADDKRNVNEKLKLV